MTQQEAAMPDGSVVPPAPTAALEALAKDIGGVPESMEEVSDYLEQAMASRAVIEQAKSNIMAMPGVPEHEAFEVLRKSSQDRNVKVGDLALQIVHGVVTKEEPGRV